MRFLTECDLRERHAAGRLTHLVLKDDERLTPGARQFLFDFRIPYCTETELQKSKLEPEHPLGIFAPCVAARENQTADISAARAGFGVSHESLLYLIQMQCLSLSQALTCLHWELADKNAAHAEQKIMAAYAQLASNLMKLAHDIRVNHMPLSAEDLPERYKEHTIENLLGSPHALSSYLTESNYKALSIVSLRKAFLAMDYELSRCLLQLNEYYYLGKPSNEDLLLLMRSWLVVVHQIQDFIAETVRYGGVACMN